MAPVFDPPTALALGSADGTGCLGNMAEITSAAACESAAAFAERPYSGSVTAAFMPRGCYWHTLAGSFYYNTDATGGVNYLAPPVCAGAADS